ncbi:Barstar (barnase inhibitor) [Paenibacillus algorifonticola]|uniref:Barstar (Barnase inhibitor) n=2 Tax=Paenibacillus algorifonticola TaxID=684063 RepID=A0A1I2E216_9BACL|nr:Barstar (barnase inhibitor) [Paenibacillus algorifonticola]
MLKGNEQINLPDLVLAEARLPNDRVVTMGEISRKFSLVDEESNIVIGYCKDILGMSGEYSIEIKREQYHRIILVNFQMTEAFREYVKKKRPFIKYILLNFLNKKGDVMGTYYFYLQKPLFFCDEKFNVQSITAEVVVLLPVTIPRESLEIWDLWRESDPMVKNMWMDLSKDQQQRWLEIVRQHEKTAPADQANGEYFLDMGIVEDDITFYCALGEAINGPGGYYGFTLTSLEDCFCGGFGAVAPFTLYISHLNKSAYECHSDNENSMSMEAPFLSSPLYDLLISNNVKVVFC